MIYYTIYYDILTTSVHLNVHNFDNRTSKWAYVDTHSEMNKVMKITSSIVQKFTGICRSNYDLNTLFWKATRSVILWSTDFGTEQKDLGRAVQF